MRVLLLGGTGAMGSKLSLLLSQLGHNVYVTSRIYHESNGDVHYIQGNAHDPSFLFPLTDKYWDVIVDFMVYSTEEFASIYPHLLDSTDQYIYLSSCRVFDSSDSLITEKSPKLLDICTNKEYRESDEYGIKKAKQERLLNDSSFLNYTIIRPYITYDEKRLQLCAMEKEKWLFRAINNKKIVVSNDILDHYTTLTYAKDVALCISQLVGCKKALSEDYNITSQYCIKWRDVLNIYTQALKMMGFKGEFVATSKCMEQNVTPYQVIYDRMFDRKFDNSKISDIVNIDYTPPQLGLEKCLKTFCERPTFNKLSWYDEGKKDRISHDIASWGSFNSIMDAYIYIKYRVGIKK